MMTAAAYVAQIAEPMLKEFRQNRTDLRRAMLASMAVLHVVDFVMQNRAATVQGTAKARARAGNNKIEEFRTDGAGSKHPGFDTVHKFALASKHGALTQHPGFDTDRHRVQTIGGPLFTFGLLGAPTEILVTLDDGSSIPLMHALDATMALYRAEFPEGFLPP